MYRNLFLAVLAVVAISACNQSKKSCDSEKCTKIEIDQFWTEAPNYVGKAVCVHGAVNHVCAHGGRKLTLVTSDSSKYLTVFAADTLPAFDSTLNGQMVCVNGVVNETIINEEYITNMLAKADSAAKISGTPQAAGDHHTPAQELAEKYRQKIKESGTDHYIVYKLTDCNKVCKTEPGCEHKK